MDTIANQVLNDSPNWKGRCCLNCGRSYPTVLLDIAAVINRGASLVCVDIRACKKAAEYAQDLAYNAAYKRNKRKTKS